MNAMKQIVAVTSIALRSLPSRVGSVFVIITGLAGAVGVLIAVLAMANSLNRTIANSGRPNRVIVLRKGADNELSSTIPRSVIVAIQSADGVSHLSDGTPIVSPEMLTVAAARSRSDGSRAEVTVRGVTLTLFATRPEIKVIAGRIFKPGLHELIVGRSAQLRFAGLAIGDRVHIHDSDWTIVGVFESGGDTRESELVGDANALMIEGQSPYQSVTAMLTSPYAFAAFKQSLESDPALSVAVQRETDYFRQQSQRLATILSIIAYLVGGIMAIGALFGALNSMYSTLSVRTVEIATLRAIGFGGSSVVASLVIEAVLLAVLGAALGVGIVWIALNRLILSTTQGGGQIVFRLQFDSSMVTLAATTALCVALLGALLPAVRAALLPTATALRVR
jgi:putative ABC transport system permease protein